MNESKKYTTYAVDFNGTLAESVWPGIGKPNRALINHLIKRRNEGNKVILWTCRCGDRLEEAVTWCRYHGLNFDAVNENLPEMVELYGNDLRKIFADVYIDVRQKLRFGIVFLSRRCKRWKRISLESTGPLIRMHGN